MAYNEMVQNALREIIEAFPGIDIAAHLTVSGQFHIYAQIPGKHRFACPTLGVGETFQLAILDAHERLRRSATNRAQHHEVWLEGMRAAEQEMR